MVLYMNSDTFTITDEEGNTVSIEAAKKFYYAGKLKDYNLSFKRLAAFGFDVDKLRNFYELHKG